MALTGLILSGILVAGGVVALVAVLTFATTRHLPRPSDGVLIGWGVFVAVANVALAVAWFLEKGEDLGPLLVALIGVWATGATVVRLHAYLLKRSGRYRSG